MRLEGRKNLEDKHKHCGEADEATLYSKLFRTLIKHIL